MNTETKRVEIRLDVNTIKILVELATKDKRSLKNYIEKLMVGHATANAITEMVKKAKRIKTKVS